ncbi:glycosyltransferase family 4 protein [Desulfopila inferna]|uniref:glycosyltransferase family 4 protein n=1 Tax=Desulfopila inferna TaxID=468528 RepID=UPI001963AF66|nr:glycosyltransferase family 4 protein [Desulfopila inferna]MBM9602687.1 glycosyltransferase family 4 protein [Desulfopila inferna]
MSNNKLKILFFIPTCFGVRGTIGTYRLIEVLSSEHDILVIAPDRPNEEKYVVHRNNDLMVIKIKDRSKSDSLNKIHQILRSFVPDIIYLFNSPSSPAYLFSLHHLFPGIKWIADFRTPLLQQGSRRRRIRNGHFLLQFYVDGIITLSRHSVKTWIPLLLKKTTPIPIGIDTSKFTPKIYQSKCLYCTRFVFIGSFHNLRKLDFLISYFSHAVQKNKERFLTLDLYGAGPAENKLRQLISKLHMEKNIFFKGLLNQEDLFQKLGDYDAGIAYVPYEKYDRSPSLKSIEYAAAGLHVLASDTSAHIQQMKDHGLHFQLFSNELNSFVDNVTECAINGVSTEVSTSNIKSVHNCDYQSIVKNHISPLLMEIVNG